MSKKKVAKITLELELRDDWKDIVAEDCGMDPDVDADKLSAKAAAAIYRRKLEDDINNQQIELVSLLPLARTVDLPAGKVRVKTFRIDYEGDD